jgi:hypothetical protein
MTAPPPPLRDVHVTNALGSFVVEVLRPTRLLVPSAKSLTAPPPPLSPSVPLDHFECYRVRGAGPKNSSSTTMQDQFVTAGEKIMQLQQLCVPVDDGGRCTLGWRRSASRRSGPEYSRARDPFDRLIAGTAVALGVPLISSTEGPASS